MEGNCVANIDLDKLKSNYLFFSNLCPNSKIIAVVKANAYGHGAVKISKELNLLNCDYFAVSSIVEALELRQNGIWGEILILGYTNPIYADILSKFYLTQTIINFEYGIKLNEFAKKCSAVIKTHIKIDTGMGRIGLNANSKKTVSQVVTLCNQSNLTVNGAFTHFAVADQTDQESVKFTDLQYTRFISVIEKASAQGVKLGLLHCANTAGTLLNEKYRLNAVRIGIGLYGISPFEFNISGISPLMSVTANVSMVKYIGVGETVGYGCSYVATKKTKIATVTVGYADGYNRQFCTNGEMLINGERAKVVGKISMDVTTIEVNDIPISCGQLVTVFDGEKLTAKELAKKLNTIPYEIICQVSSRVPRVYYRKGEIIH